MADILSQKEIDALLSALDGGDVSAEEIQDDRQEVKIRDYDFKSPNKLSKDQLKTISFINDNYSRLLNTYLSGYMRAFTNIEVSSVEEVSYYEFINSISNPAMLAIINFDPLPGQIVFDISDRLSFAMVDRVLGGDGKILNTSRTFTEIEEILMTNLMKKMIEYMIDPWANVVELSPVLEKIESNSQFVQIASPNETVALVTFTAKMGDTEGLMNICLPHMVIEPVLPKLTTNYLFSTFKKDFDLEGKEKLEKRIKKTNVMSWVEVGQTFITVEDFIFMQKGDVIKLDRRIDEPLELKIEGKTKFLGLPGTYRNNMAFMVSKVVDKGGDEENE